MCIDIYFLVKYFSEVGGNKDSKLTHRRFSNKFCTLYTPSYSTLMRPTLVLSNARRFYSSSGDQYFYSSRQHELACLQACFLPSQDPNRS